MTAPLILNEEQIFDIIMAELPAGVYATDRADSPDYDKRSVSSSEIRATARTLADLYNGLDDVNKNKFITTLTTSGLINWEKELFAAIQDSSQPFLIRQQNLLAKFRASGGISKPVIEGIVHGVLDPVGLSFALIPLSGSYGGVWILEQSHLDIDTFLSGGDPLLGANLDAPLDCDLDYVAAGLTLEQLQSIQRTAYAYQVKIYGDANADTLALLDRLLTMFEPARSTHIIVNNASADGVPDGIFGGDFTTPVFYSYIEGGLFTEPSASYSVVDGGTW